MNNTANTIPLSEFLLDLWTHGLNDTSVITSNPRSGVSISEVDMLPVCGVKTDGIDFDENVVLAEFGDGDVMDSGFAFIDVYNCFGGHRCDGRSR